MLYSARRDQSRGSRNASRGARFGGDVGVEVGAHHERIVVAQALHDRLEAIDLAQAEEAADDQIEHLGERGAARDERARVVAGGPQGGHLGGGEAEQEEVLRADRVADLDVGAVERARR